MGDKDVTLTPQIIAESYERIYLEVNGVPATIRHVGGQWYYVNGETVHRFTLITEISRLQEVAEHQRRERADRSMIHRLIARLRRI